MIYSSLAILAVAASAAIPPFGNLVHLHPHTQTDDRVQVTLVNHASLFRDVRIAGHTYTVNAGGAHLRQSARRHARLSRQLSLPITLRGEVLIALTPAVNEQTIEVK